MKKFWKPEKVYPSNLTREKLDVKFSPTFIEPLISVVSKAEKEALTNEGKEQS